MSGSITDEGRNSGLSGLLEKLAAIGSKRHSEMDLKNEPAGWGETRRMLMQDFVDTDPYAWKPVDRHQR